MDDTERCLNQALDLLIELLLPHLKNSGCDVGVTKNKTPSSQAKD